MKIVTGIGNQILNKKLRQIKGTDVLFDDFDTDEDLLEYLESAQKVDILFISCDI